MRCVVESKEILSTSLSYREMNFGQSVGDLELLSYSVSIETSEFVELFQKSYDRFALEEKEDEPYHEKGVWPKLDRLRELKYPPLNELIETGPDIVEYLIKELLTLDVLEALLSYSGDQVRFAINTVDDAKVSKESIVFEGQAFPIVRKA